MKLKTSDAFFDDYIEFKSYIDDILKSLRLMTQTILKRFQVHHDNKNISNGSDADSKWKFVIFRRNNKHKNGKGPEQVGIMNLLKPIFTEKPTGLWRK